MGASAPVPLIGNPTDRRLPKQTRIASRTPIILEGSSYRTTLRILEGCVALYQELADGRRLILDILGPGRILGARLVDIRRCKAMALAPSSIETFAADGEDGIIADALRHMLFRAQAHAVLLGRKSAAERVATALLDLADQFARKSRSPSGNSRTTFTLHLQRIDLADWLGLTLETVCRCLSAFKRSRLIAFDHPEIITISDRAALEALAAGSPLAARAA